MEKIGNYELLFIVHPDLESSIDKTVAKVRSYVEKRDGKIIYEENWGKRKLAYPINKAEVGIYVLWYLNVPKNKLASIEKDLRINEEVMRYLLLTVEEKKEAKPKIKKVALETEIAPTVDKKATAKETTEKPKETEKERMKKIDKQLEVLLGEEEPKK